MTQTQKIEGKAIARILDARNGDVVGYLFQWNNGDIDPKWIDDMPRNRKDVVYDYT